MDVDLCNVCMSSRADSSLELLEKQQPIVHDHGKEKNRIWGGEEYVGVYES